MNVKRLIELLTMMDQEAEVYAEGCDCIEEAVGVSVPTENSYYGSDGRKSVMIRRERGSCYDEEGEIIK